MPRRPRPSGAGAASGAGAGSATPSPFAALRALRGKPAESVQRAPAAGAARPDTAAPPAIDEAADAALFQRAVAGTAPLRSAPRVELERPRPAPQPRPRPAQTDETEPARPRAPADPLAAAYEGVTRLRDSGRIDLGPRPRNREHPLGAARAHDKSAHPAGELPGVVLPPDADLDDPVVLFRRVMQGAAPLDQRNRVELVRPAPEPAPIKREEDEREALNESLAAPLSFEDRLDMGDEAAFLRPGLPRRVLSDLRRGRWTRQGEIDLHGLTRDQARAALAQFLASALQQGKRCIRVIHGKGLGSPGKFSILKQLSRGWLAQREEILAFCQAGPHDGGGGALLVLMRAQNAPRR